MGGSEIKDIGIVCVGGGGGGVDGVFQKWSRAHFGRRTTTAIIS